MIKQNQKIYTKYTDDKIRIKYQPTYLQVSMANHTNEPMSPQRQQMCNTNGYHYMTPPLPPSSDHSNHNMGINVR